MHQGRTRAGIDCIGLLIEVGKALGKPVLDLQGYSRWPDGTELKRMMGENPSVQELPQAQMQESDVLLFWITHKGYPQHTGILGQRGRSLLHTHQGAGKVLEERMTDWWEKRIDSVWRVL